MGPRQRHSRKRAKTRVVPIVVASVFGFLLLAGIAFGVGMLGNVQRWLSDLPDYTDANEYLVSEPTHILDANGNEMATFFVQNRQSITKDQVSPYVLKGTVDVEDERFYEHNGVDIIGIGRAVVAQLTGRSEGASTITQQLVRNTILSEEQFDQTIERKVREAWIAIKMEETYSKDEILMMYLNTIYYGHGAYGIQAAAKTYLSKNASDLTLAEAALLVGLPNSPSYYDPTVNPDGAVERRNKVLDNMLRIGSITQEEHDAAQAEPLALNVTETSDSGITVYSQPYFVDYVKSLLQEEFSTDVLFKGGLTVKTTIDPTIQQVAEAAAVNNINKYQAAAGLDIGMTVIDPKTGYIKAMVGGRDYNRTDADANGQPVQKHVNRALSKLQPGSSFKTFTLLTAVSQGMNPDITVNAGSPITWKIPGQKDYKAQNWGNISYGYTSLRHATAVSSNTAYLQVAEVVGNQNIIAMCKKLGLDTSTMQDVLAMTLGTGSFDTVEMASAYATLAAGGVHREPVAITEIDSRDGSVLYQHQDKPEQVVDAGVAQAVTEVLEGVLTGDGTGASGNPYINQPVAGKTGTAGTADRSDQLWFCGYTPQYSVAINVGDYEGDSTAAQIGSLMGDQMTLPVFRELMQALLANAPREEFPTGNKPNYKNNSEWKFSKTNAVSEGKNTNKKDDEEDKDTEDKPEQENPTTPTNPTNPTPTPEPEPGPEPEPTPDPEPEPEPEPNPNPNPGGDGGSGDQGGTGGGGNTGTGGGTGGGSDAGNGTRTVEPPQVPEGE